MDDTKATASDAWVSAMRKAEELIDAIQTRGRQQTHKLTADQCQALANQTSADYQECSMVFGQAEEALAQLKSKPPTSADGRLVWERKMARMRADWEASRSHAQTIFKTVQETLKARAAVAAGGGENGGADRRSARLAEESDLLTGASRMAADSLASGARVLGSLDRQATLLGSVGSRLRAIGEDLGRSSLLARVVGQRAQADNQLVAALTVVTTLTIVILYLYVRGYFG